VRRVRAADLARRLHREVLPDDPADVVLPKMLWLIGIMLP
jgi:hypothetical protein